MAMKFGVSIVPFTDPGIVVDMAVDAETEADLLTPDQLAESLDGIKHPADWDVFTSLTPGYSVADWEKAGATWLIEGAWPAGDWVTELTGRIEKGPPR